MKKIVFILAIVGIVLGWFYWFQWRPMKIRQNCFKDVYSDYPGKLEWAEGKEWMFYSGRTWGWLYPYWRIRDKADIYKGCLTFFGV